MTESTLVSVWQGTVPPRDALNSQPIYSSLQRNGTYMTLSPISQAACVADVEEAVSAFDESIRSSAHSDTARMLLRHVKSVRGGSESILGGEFRYLQLRAVEVLPRKYLEYAQWREETIFDAVERSTSESFQAYHSAVSGDPGVWFVSGFNGSVAEHNEVFTDDKYESILAHVRANFITTERADRGLSVETFERIEAQS